MTGENRGGMAVRWGLVLSHAFLAIGAVAAGQALIRRPDGTLLGFSRQWLAGSPLRDYRVPGWFLMGVIGPANLAGALLLARRSPTGSRVSVATGLLLITWLGIQTAIIGIRHWSQGIWWVMFPAIALGAAVLSKLERDGATG